MQMLLPTWQQLSLMQLRLQPKQPLLQEQLQQLLQLQPLQLAPLSLTTQ
jgi:hypothetical protein